MTRDNDMALMYRFMRKFGFNPTWSSPPASEFLSYNGITKRKGPREWRASEAHLTTEEIAAVLGVKGSASRRTTFELSEIRRD